MPHCRRRDSRFHRAANVEANFLAVCATRMRQRLRGTVISSPFNTLHGSSRLSGPVGRRIKTLKAKVSDACSTLLNVNVTPADRCVTNSANSKISSDSGRSGSVHRRRCAKSIRTEPTQPFRCCWHASSVSAAASMTALRSRTQ